MKKNETHFLGCVDIPDGYSGKRATVWLCLDESDGAVLAVYDCGYFRFFPAFTVERYPGARWTPKSYARNKSWVCIEDKHFTTCEFYESEIFAGLVQRKNLHTFDSKRAPEMAGAK